MPKATPAKGFNWRLAMSIVAGFLLFVALFESTALATRTVRSMLLGDERFILESNFTAGGDGAASDVPGIHIEGNHYTARDRILRVFSPDLNKSIFLVPLAERRRRLLAIDWIEEASIMRVWPNQLIVKVRERRPVAFARLPIGTGSQFRYLLIDAQGVLLGVPRQRFDFPVLTGVTEDQPEAERKTRVVSMQRLLHALGPAAGTVSDINASSLQDMRISSKISGHTVELWLGDRNYLARFQNFANHFDEIQRQSDGASVFDLRLDDRIMTVDKETLGQPKAVKPESGRTKKK